MNTNRDPNDVGALNCPRCGGWGFTEYEAGGGDGNPSYAAITPCDKCRCCELCGASEVDCAPTVIDAEVYTACALCDGTNHVARAS